jgi:hypothetical protein
MTDTKRLERTLTVEQAPAFYNRLGSRQDWQRFFEWIAVPRKSEPRPRSVGQFGVLNLDPGSRSIALDSRRMPSDDLRGFLSPSLWQFKCIQLIPTKGITSQVVVASKCASKA